MNSIVGNSYVTYLVKYTWIPHGMGGECEVLCTLMHSYCTALCSYGAMRSLMTHAQ